MLGVRRCVVGQDPMRVIRRVSVEGLGGPATGTHSLCTENQSAMELSRTPNSLGLGLGRSPPSLNETLNLKTKPYSIYLRETIIPKP